MISVLNKVRGRTQPACPEQGKIALLFLFALFTSLDANAQEIDFGDYSSKYGITLTEITPGDDLEFGTVIQNGGFSAIDISNAKTFSIEGVKYLDVLVDITADEYLFLGTDIACNGSNSNCIPFTLQAAFANRGDFDLNDAVNMTVLSNVATAQFPILARENAPPGPPPTPVYNGYNPAVFNETAYLFIYGSISVGNVDSGIYTGNITISISYD